MILFGGSEDIDFIMVESNGFPVVEESVGYWRDPYVRCGIRVYQTGSTADPAPALALSKPFPGTHHLWVHAQTFQPAAALNNQQGLLVYSPDGVARIVVRQTAQDGIIKVSTRNAAGQFVDLGSASKPYAGTLEGTWPGMSQFDLEIDYANERLNLFLDKENVLTYEGPLRTDDATQLSQFALGSLGAGGTVWSEVIGADQDTRKMALFAAPPILGGPAQDWVPEIPAWVNDAIINDNTLIRGDPDQFSEWAVPTELPSGIWAVPAIIQQARVKNTGSGRVEFALRTDGLDYTTGNRINLTTNFVNLTNIWPLNPATGKPWTEEDINSTLNPGLVARA